MGSFRSNIEEWCVRGRLKPVMYALLSVFIIIVSYLLYRQAFISGPDPKRLFILVVLSIPAFAVLVLLCHAFNALIIISSLLRRAAAGRMVMAEEWRGMCDPCGMFASWNRFITRHDAMLERLEQLDVDLQGAFDERIRLEDTFVPLKKAVDIMQIGVTVTDRQGRIIYTNIADARMHGYEVEELLGRDVRIFAPKELHRKIVPEEYQHITNWSRESLNIRNDGTVFPVRVTSDAVVDGRGEVVGIVTTCEDISEQKRSQEALLLRQRVIESSSNGIMVIDTALPGNPISYVNPAFEQITGYSSQEKLGCGMEFLFGGDLDQIGLGEIRAALHEQREGSAVLRNYRKDGSLFWNDLAVVPVRDDAGAVKHFVGIINDITERELHEERFAYQANYDGLTGLPNRNLLADRIKQSIAHAQRNNLKMAILFIDLDQFKVVNDSLGHALGDRLLRIEAERLQKIIRSADTVARYGGDEFVIVVNELHSASNAATIAHGIQETLSRPFTIDDQEMRMSCSIGISIYPKDGKDMESLLKNADAAMYRAKEQGRNTFRFYTDEMNDRLVERMTMERHLRHALEKGELEVHFQPQVDMRTGRVIAVEALLRWHSPELGLVPPSRFIPLAEETDLILPIGEWVLDTCCRQNKAWQDAGFPPMTVSVNISPRQLQKNDLAGTISRVLRESGLEPCFLELEIVESMLMHDVERALVVLAHLKALGVRLAMDDFGTGYSCLSYLKRFPFDKLKIDASFVRDIMTDSESAAIVRTIVAMAHNLNLRVIAEGIEAEEQLEFLRHHGCDEMQGYYFSHPLPARALEDLLRENLLRENPVADPANATIQD